MRCDKGRAPTRWDGQKRDKLLSSGGGTNSSCGDGAAAASSCLNKAEKFRYCKIVLKIGAETGGALR